MEPEEAALRDAYEEGWKDAIIRMTELINQLGV